MREQLTQEEIKQGWLIHDQIKNHPFRKCPELYMFDEYADLIKKMTDFVCGWIVEDIVTNENGEKVYEKAFVNVKRNLLCNVSWANEPKRINIEVWSNPNIAIINDAVHDYNGIKWRLKYRWSKGDDVRVTLGKYIEMSELMLMLFHRLLEGEEIAEVQLPKDDSVEGTHELYKYVRNPKFDNYWTYPWATKEGFYVED